MVDQHDIMLREPEIVQGVAMTFAGEKIGFSPEKMQDIPLLWNRFGPRTGSIPGETGDAAFGLGLNFFTAGQGPEYMAAVLVGDASKLPPDLMVLETPARLFAVFPFEDHVSVMGSTVGAIWRQWLPGSGYELDIVPGAPDVVERYGPGFDPAIGKGDITIWIPVKPSAR